MSTFGYFKIQSEIENKIDLGKGQVFDNTEWRIFHIEPEIYEEEFEALVLEFGKPINTFQDFDDFEIWLVKDKKLNVRSIGYNFIENYTDLKKRQEKNNRPQHARVGRK